jgi:aminopeptidase N
MTNQDVEQQPLLPQISDDGQINNGHSNSGQISSHERINNGNIKKLVVIAGLIGLVGSIGLSHASSNGVSNGLSKTWTEMQLPKIVYPTEYRLNLISWLEPEFKFAGNVQIDLTVTQNTRIIVIHSLELLLSQVKLLTDKGIVYPTLISSHSPNEMTTLHFDKILEKGSLGTLSINFKGNITASLFGYYKSVYNYNDEVYYLASTQFESTDARRAFPCFDEPSFKATFLLNFTVKYPYKVLSNMKSVGTIPVQFTDFTDLTRDFSDFTDLTSDLTSDWTSDWENGEENGLGEKWRKFIFPATPRMCTYLVAWVTSRFESISAQTKRGVEINIWTQPGKSRLGKYALQVSIHCLDYYEDLYQINYPLEKLDQIAIPDFGSGAMENWGLVTYRDTALLYDPDLSSALDKQRVAEVVCHELAHQWTGNLVSMKWWNDLFLNEGFAEFTEYIGAEAAARAQGEDWRMQDQFYSIDMTSALNADASIWTHAITGRVENPAEIEEIFDAISYSKGASLIRMLRAWVNNVNTLQKKKLVPDHDWFFSRMTIYLNKHKYSNADTKNLWMSIDEFDADGKAKMGVEETMSRWTDQPGYPVVILSPTNNGMMIRQERFLYNHYTKSEEIQEMETNQTWWIPFTYMIYTNDTKDGMPAAHSGPFTVLLTERETFIPQVVHGFANPNNPKAYYFVKANVNQTAPYRVLYPELDIAVVADWVGQRFFLPPVGRAGFVSDCVNMALSGRLTKIEPVLDLIDELLRPLAAEDEYVVWVTVIDLLNRLFLHGAYEIHPSFGDLADWMQKLVRPAVKAVGWHHVQGEPYLRRLLRTELLKFAVQVGEPDTVATARQLFKHLTMGVWEQEGKLLDPDILSTIYDAEMIAGDMSSYELILSLWRNATFAVEKNRLLHALCRAKPLWLVRRNLDFIFSPEVRLQDTFSALMWTTTSSYAANQESWSYFRDHWDELAATFRASLGQRFGDVVNVVASTMGSEALLQDMELWFKAQLGECDPHDEVDVDCRRNLPPMGGRNVRKGSEIARMKMNFVNRFGGPIWTWMKYNP